MDSRNAQFSSDPELRPASERLDSWKEIAAYLKRDERTVRRWEKEGLPVHRHTHKKKATVYAYKSEIDSWWDDGATRLEDSQGTGGNRKPRLGRSVVAGLTLLSLALFGLNVGDLRDRWLDWLVTGEITSIAVLPLENLSGDSEEDYFADGMTEALITELGKISALRLISRQSVMQYKETKSPLAQIMRELNVDAVVKGAVVREGDRVRVTAQLIQVGPERHLWTNHYERDLTSILLLQSEVAGAIAREVGASLTTRERVQLDKARPVNPQAHDAYLRGLLFMEEITRQGITQGIAYFRQAIDLDPTYAAAYAALADAYNRAAIQGYEPPKEAYPAAKAALSKAIQLDDGLPEAHVLDGVIKFRYDWDWTAAERGLKRGIELNPNSSRAHLGYSTYSLAMGRIEDAIRLAERALILDPLTALRHTHLGWLLSFAGRHDDAISHLQAALRLAPMSMDSRSVIALNYAVKSMQAEAISHCEGALALPVESPVLADCGRVYALAGRQDAGREILERMLAQDYVSPYQVALVCDALDDRKQAVEWLFRAYDTRAPEMCLLKIDTFSAQLRSDPCFQDILRRMKFPK
jgi:TolB-like protein/tetratricopeptide (TPR) repeat protein